MTSETAYEALIYYSEQILQRQAFVKDKKFIIDSRNKQIYKNVAYYLVRDPKSSLNLDKGLFLRGSRGTGKTILMKAIKALAWDLVDIGVKFTTAIELVDIYGSEDHAEKKKLRNFTLVLDDLGTEQTEIKVWGTDVMPFVELLTYRYSESKITHITTNLLPSELIEIYGSRIFERIGETCNDIVFEGPSRRI